ncbi:hypothetical protein D3C80_2062590 [compost metagenome]
MCKPMEELAMQLQLLCHFYLSVLTLVQEEWVTQAELQVLMQVQCTGTRQSMLLLTAKEE